LPTAHEDLCKICQHGPDRIDWTKNNYLIAASLGIAEGSVRRHLKWVRANGFEDGTTNTVTSGTDIPDTNGTPGKWIARRRWQTPQGEVLNSFQFIPDDFDIEVNDDRIDAIISSAFGTVPPAAEPGVKRNGKTEFANPADLQLGKHERGIGTPETIQKFNTSLDEVVARWTLLKPHEGYLSDLGDLIENIYSTPSQTSTNDRTVPQQVEDAIALYMVALGRLLPLTDKLMFVTVTSNHGEARSAPKTNPYDSENDWGLHIFRALKSRCEDRGWDVNFVRPAQYEDTAVVETSDGTVVAFTHGHHSGTPASMEKWIVGQIVGHCEGWNADIWVHGHYHNPTHFSVGDGIDVFGTPSLDPGSAWFAKKSGKRARQGIVCFTVDKGLWFNYSIL